MTMHLEGPWLSLNGKRKGKVKFRTADEARRHRELEASWAKIKAQYGVEQEQRRQRKGLDAEPLKYSLSAPPGRETQNIPSLGNGMGNAPKREVPKYTGTKIKGIGTMHKSNAVPIFSDDEAEAIAHMRR
jgi:hypothetical protein